MLRNEASIIQAKSNRLYIESGEFLRSAQNDNTNEQMNH
nr:hypothetical protein [Mucilaginibacter sp. X5P1]